MPPFDYNAPAELFLAKPTKGSRTKYRRFATAAEAIRYAVEDLRTFGAWLQVGDERFNSVEIQRLYEDGEYPCGNQRVTKRTRRYRIGSPLQSKLRISTPTP
jgi:Arc/MetJ-type ribon-helix-helix transcriptional regulator